MKIRFASWNVNNRLLKPTHLEFLRQVNPDILALQEVNPKFYEALSDKNIFSCSDFSLLIRPPQENDKKGRRLGCALFGQTPFHISASFVFDQMPLPERMLIAKFETSEKHLIACSFHTPPGASWGKVKPQSHKLLAEWLALQEGSVVLGIDANAPKTDHPDITKNEWWWKDEPLLLGENPLHELQDSFRVYLNTQPDILEAVRQQRPNGPLAVSHIRGKGRKRTQCRYDFIYITPDIKVNQVKYLYEEAVKAGSDHAIVIAELEILEGVKQ